MMTPLDFTKKLALQAGELLMDYFQSQNKRTSFKPDRSVVTEADIASDRLITATIQDRYPTDAIISEELNPRLPEYSIPAVWIVDPLDGTTNFNLGLHHWGVSIGRIAGDSFDVAAIYFPLLNELFSAQQGEGAHLNGVRIQVSPPPKDNPITFFTCCSRAHRYYQVNVPYKTRILGSASYSLCNVARGVATLCFEAKPKIWDIAGGWLLVQEAGGVTECFDGIEPFPLVLGKDYKDQSYPILSGPTRHVVERARQQIQPR